MASDTRRQRLRSWAPIPTSSGIQPVRWLLLEGNRHAVTGALLTVTFVTIMVSGEVWTFEIQNLLTETEAVEVILNTLLSEIILLVSVVVSINAIVLSYDITSITAQEDRIESALDFRRKLDDVGDGDENPTDPSRFLQMMSKQIQERVRELEAVTDGAAEKEFAQEVQEHAELVAGTANVLEQSLEQPNGGDFGILWRGIETDYGTSVNRTRRLISRHQLGEEGESAEAFEDLIRTLELFAVGRELFKTLFYNREIANLSRTLLVASLPAILVTAITILAINAELLPNIWLLGLPPLLTFVSATFTVALTPYIILTSYMLRIATVAQRSAGTGLFSLRS